MRPEIEQPTIDERGDQRHPAWGLIGAHRTQTGPTGTTLFDSDIRHQHTVVVRLYGATRKRDLSHDWVHTDSRLPYVEVEMSEAQWASFVSSMNVGDGVPCTIRATRDGAYQQTPEVPYEPRLQESMNEVRDAAEHAQAKVLEALEAYLEKKNAANLRTLEYAIRNMPSNVTFAAKSLSKHAENVVQRARADIEAMVVSKATQLGIEPGDLGMTPQLTAGDGEEISDDR